MKTSREKYQFKLKKDQIFIGNFTAMSALISPNLMQYTTGLLLSFLFLCVSMKNIVETVLTTSQDGWMSIEKINIII